MFCYYEQCWICNFSISCVILHNCAYFWLIAYIILRTYVYTTSLMCSCLSVAWENESFVENILQGVTIILTTMLYVKSVQDSNFRLGILAKVRLWPRICSDCCPIGVVILWWCWPGTCLKNANRAFEICWSNRFASSISRPNFPSNCPGVCLAA